MRPEPKRESPAFMRGEEVNRLPPHSSSATSRRRQVSGVEAELGRWLLGIRSRRHGVLVLDPGVVAFGVLRGADSRSRCALRARSRSPPHSGQTRGIFSTLTRTG